MAKATVRKKSPARRTAKKSTTRRKRKAAPAKSTPVKRILNCVPSKQREDDWGIENAIAANVLKRTRIPKSKDLREDWWKVGDQANTGACVGWASADSVIRWHMVKDGRLDKKEPLSVRFLWMAAKETDEFKTPPTTFIESDGTSLKSALDIARKYGCVTDNVLSFANTKLYTGETKTFYMIAAQRKITSYVNLKRDLKAWREWIATQGPILTRLDCDDAWMDAKDTGGVLTTYDPTTADGGHAVAIVGYDENMFIIRNSWGTTQWGDKGFAYASNAYAAAAFTEAYGVVA